MRRSSPAPRSFVLALLRALHPWPRLRFGAATPPPGKVHSTNQINRSPLTGGLRTDKVVRPRVAAGAPPMAPAAVRRGHATTREGAFHQPNQPIPVDRGSPHR